MTTKIPHNVPKTHDKEGGAERSSQIFLHVIVQPEKNTVDEGEFNFEIPSPIESRHNVPSRIHK